jgi:hypothetical protein
MSKQIPNQAIKNRSQSRKRPLLNAIKSTFYIRRNPDCAPPIFQAVILEQYFDAVELRCAKKAQGEIQGFYGVHDGNIEIQFISPDARI